MKIFNFCYRKSLKCFSSRLPSIFGMRGFCGLIFPQLFERITVMVVWVNKNIMQFVMKNNALYCRFKKALQYNNNKIEQL